MSRKLDKSLIKGQEEQAHTDSHVLLQLPASLCEKQSKLRLSYFILGPPIGAQQRRCYFVRSYALLIAGDSDDGKAERYSRATPCIHHKFVAPIFSLKFSIPIFCTLPFAFPFNFAGLAEAFIFSGISSFEDFTSPLPFLTLYLESLAVQYCSLPRTRT